MNGSVEDPDVELSELDRALRRAGLEAKCGDVDSAGSEVFRDEEDVVVYVGLNELIESQCRALAARVRPKRSQRVRIEILGGKLELHSRNAEIQHTEGSELGRVRLASSRNDDFASSLVVEEAGHRMKKHGGVQVLRTQVSRLARLCDRSAPDSHARIVELDASHDQAKARRERRGGLAQLRRGVRGGFVEGGRAPLPFLVLVEMNLGSHETDEVHEERSAEEAEGIEAHDHVIDEEEGQPVEVESRVLGHANAAEDEPAGSQAEVFESDSPTVASLERGDDVGANPHRRQHRSNDVIGAAGDDGGDHE